MNLLRVRACFAALLVAAATIALGCRGTAPAGRPLTSSQPAGSSSAGFGEIHAGNQGQSDRTLQPPVDGPLGDEIAPAAYHLEVELDPSEAVYDGAMRIELRVAKPTSIIWLHAESIAIDEAVLYVDGSEDGTHGAKRRAIAVALPVKRPSRDLIGLVLAEPVPVGQAALSLRFSGVFGRQVGLFRQESDNQSYLFTDFEPIDARRAFPCFDEPRFKTPWTISMVIPETMTGLSNMPEKSVETLAKGRKRIRFEPTRPLPTYLVAMAVGPFDIVEAGRAPPSRETGQTPGSAVTWPGSHAASDVPIRIVVPRGKATWARPAARMAPDLLARAAEYLAAPVPFPKLDFISVPQLSGAMENPGLITMGAHIVLSDPNQPSLPQLRLLAKVLAHEIAHLWFGDLVTPKGWNDLWLNEGFATWMADKLLDEWDPGRNQPLERAAEKDQAMTMDSFVGSRAMREVGHTREQVRLAFDPISYLKGGAVLTMLEGWLSPEVFRKASRTYLNERADGNVSADEFLAVFSRVAGRDLGPVVRGLVDESGVPTVAFKLDCSRDNPAIGLRQKRYLTLSDKDRAGAKAKRRAWQVPVCVRYGAGGKSQRQCTLLEGRAGRMELTSKRCPTWLVPNAGATGYYRYRMSPRLLAALGRAPMSGAERVDLINNVRALLHSGDMSAKDALTIIEDLAKERSQHGISTIVDLLAEIADTLLEAPNRRRFQAWASRFLGPRARALGFAQKRREPDEHTLLRPAVIGFVGRHGADRAIIAQARRLTRRWLSSGRGIARGMIGETLGIAAFHGDAALYKTMLTELEGAEAGQERRQFLLAALGGFRQPELIERSLALLEDIDLEQSVQLMRPILKSREGTARAVKYLGGKAKSLEGRQRFLLLFPATWGAACSESEVDAMARLVDKDRELSEMARPALAKQRKRARACAAFQTAHADGARAYFK